MSYLKRIFNIEKWTYKELLLFVGAFLVLNLLAPRGFVQWLLIQQDIRRVKNEMIETRERTEKLEQEIQSFQGSQLIKEQKLRELGYLKPGELSLEFVDSSRKNASRAKRSNQQNQDSELSDREPAR